MYPTFFHKSKLNKKFNFCTQTWTINAWTVCKGVIQFPLYIIIAYDIIKKSGKEDSKHKTTTQTLIELNHSRSSIHEILLRSATSVIKTFLTILRTRHVLETLLVVRAAGKANVIISRRISAGRSIWELLEKFTDTVIYGKITVYFKGCSMFH